MVWENVPGAFSSNGGKDFAAVIEEIIKICEPDADVQVCVPDQKWTKSGCYYSADGRWSIAWRVHDAQFWGVPQRRKRIALVADFGGLSAPEILFERKGVHWNTEQSEQERKTTSGDSEGSTDKSVSIYDARGNGNGTVANTMTGDHQNRVTDYTSLVCEPTYCIQGNCIDRADTAGCNGKGWTENVSYTLNTIDRPAVSCVDVGFFNSYEEKATTLLARMYKDPPIVNKHIVRRLTPLECERLQGFPDGWTDIGDWIDSKGKTHKASDSPRYNALGNSIALPYWKVLLKRISAQYDRDATMASLFDGIGGFPYIWERLNGKGSCLWASEIEEFPMAVTKVRFGDVK
jgi:DNA (cytosine-5)-methyltransferase 1